MRLRLVPFLIAWPLAASAETLTGARSIQDCERIKVDLVYNQCLAKFGPAANIRPGVVAPGQDPEVATPANPRRFGRLAKRKGGAISRERKKAALAVRSGRKKASFAVKAGRKQGKPAKRAGAKKRR